jgi:hypothetical protein
MSTTNSRYPWMGVILLAAIVASCSRIGGPGASASNKAAKRSATSEATPAGAAAAQDETPKPQVGADDPILKRVKQYKARIETSDSRSNLVRPNTTGGTHVATASTAPQPAAAIETPIVLASSAGNAPSVTPAQPRVERIAAASPAPNVIPEPLPTPVAIATVDNSPASSASDEPCEQPEQEVTEAATIVAEAPPPPSDSTTAAPPAAPVDVPAVAAAPAPQPTIEIKAIAPVEAFSPAGIDPVTHVEITPIRGIASEPVPPRAEELIAPVAAAPTVTTDSEPAAPPAAEPEPEPTPVALAASKSPPSRSAPTPSPAPSQTAVPAIASVSITSARTATNRPADALPAAPPATLPTTPPNVNRPPQGPGEASIAKMIRDLEAAVAKQPNDLESQLRLRMLYTVLGQEDKAMTPTPGMNGDALEMVRGLVKPVIEVCKEANRDPAACATRQLAAVEELRSFLRTRADLTIPRLVLCRSVDGFDHYDAIEPAEIAVGKAMTCQLYIEVDNFLSQRTPKNEFRTHLSMRTSLLSKEGRELWATVDPNVEDVARQMRRDFFLAKEVIFPANLPVGEYVMKVEIEDKLGGKANSKSLSFKVANEIRAASAAPRTR